MIVDERVEVCGTREIYKELAKRERLNYEILEEKIDDVNGRLVISHKSQRVLVYLPSSLGNGQYANVSISGSVLGESAEEVMNEMITLNRLNALAISKGYRVPSIINDGNYLEYDYKVPLRGKDDLERVILDFNFE